MDEWEKLDQQELFDTDNKCYELYIHREVQPPHAVSIICKEQKINRTFFFKFLKKDDILCFITEIV